MSVALPRPPLTVSRSLRVALALARQEGIRLLRHPIFITGFVLSLFMFGLLTWHSAPVLHRDDTHTPGALLPLAAATLIVANLAAIRASRHGTDELFEGLPTEAAARALGHLASLLWAVVAAIAALAIMFGNLMLGDPVGMPRFTEVAAGPTVVFLFGAIGIALAQWKKHVAIAPIAVVALGAIQVLLIQPITAFPPTSNRMPWFAPWTPSSLTSGVPPELVIRSSGWHLMYLLGLAALVVVAALLRHRSRRPLIPLVVVGALLLVGGSFGQLRPPSASERARLAALVERPEDFQVCRDIEGNTYCAYKAYEPWIDRWAGAIGGVLEQLPPEARPRGLLIRQSFGRYFEGWVDAPRRALRNGYRATRADIQVGYEWGRGSSEGFYEFGIIMPVVTRALGLPTSTKQIRLTEEDVTLLRETLLPHTGPKQREHIERRLVVGRKWESCYILGQARAAVGFWLASQATDATRHSAEMTARQNPYGLTFYERHYYYNGPFSPLYGISFGRTADYSVLWPDAEFHYGVALLSHPDDEVGDELLARWDEFTDPATPTTEVLQTFDIDPLPTLEEQVRDAPAGYTAMEGSPIRSPEKYLYGNPPCH